MFLATSKFGFPHKVGKIVTAFNEGIMSLEDCLAKMSEMYPSNIKTVYTYENNKKCGHTCIEFGCPVVAQYVFKEV